MTRKNIFWVVLLSVSLAIVACQQNTTRTTWSYEQFIQAAEQNQVERVTIAANRSQAIVITQTGETAQVDLPNDPNLLSTLDRLDVQIVVAPQVDDSVVGRVFSSLLIPVMILVVTQGFWVWMLIDCAVQEASEGNTKIAWVIIIVFANLLGAIIYFFVRRPQRRRELGR